MRRKCAVLAALLFSLQTTGCGVINLTSQENSVIAEYIASVLLKHDKNYEPTLQYALEEPEDELEEKPQKQEETPKQEQNQETNNPKPTEGTDTQEPEDTVANVSVSDVYRKGMGLSVSKVDFYQSYPKKEGVLPVEASKGNTICVVSLKVKNNSSSDMKCNFLTDERTYALDINGKNTYNAVQSLLVNDIQYLDETIKAGGSYQAVVTFEVPKSAKKKSFNLLITKGSKTAALKVQ